MELTRLKKLVETLRASGVQRFKDKEIEIEFHAQQGPLSLRDPVAQEEVAGSLPLKPAAPSPEPIEPTESADDLMNYDTVLNWSGSPDPDDKSFPLAGDAPLSEAT